MTKIVRFKGDKYKIVSYTKGARTLANAFWTTPNIAKLTGKQWWKVQNLQRRFELARKFPPKSRKK